MRSKSIGIFFLLILIITPVGLSAQTGDTDVPPDITAEEGFEISLDLRIGSNLLGIIPGVSAVIGVPMTISPDTVCITPQFGFLYYFDVMSDLHNSFYLPFGISLLYSPMSTGIDIMYYQPAGGANTNSILSTMVVSEFEIYKKGNFSFLFELKFGPSFIYDSAGSRVFAMVDFSFIPRYKL